ncbi:MAG: GuaB3 family IMP dehydrogenase-related protein [bacterium]
MNPEHMLTPEKLEEQEWREVGAGRKARWTYGFDEVALVPGLATVDPDDVDISAPLAGLSLKIPFIASAMDSAVDADFAAAFWNLGGLGVLNLLGLQTRYEDPEEALKRIRGASKDAATAVIQEVYQTPVKPAFIEKRVREIKSTGAPAAVSVTPTNAMEFSAIAESAGADLLFLQSTVTSVRHYTSKGESLSVERMTKKLKIPVIVGNCVTFEVALELMREGAAGILVGVGPGAACTTRVVTGVGVPQVTATADVSAARDRFYDETGRFVPVITDGGMRTGSDVAKAFAAGADLVMMGSVFARCEEAPGRGFHWGMATGDPLLPRGTRVQVRLDGPLKTLLFGPAHRDDGTLNFVGALQNAMGLCGARTISEMHKVQMVIAPSFRYEGKHDQFEQSVGMGK